MRFSSIKFRLNLTTIVSLIIMSALIVASVNHFQKKYAVTVAEDKAFILLQHDLATHHNINKQIVPNIFLLTNKPPPGSFDSTWMPSTYAVGTIDKEYRQHAGPHYYKEAAINARSAENEADAFERDFIQRLNTDRTLNKLSVTRSFQGKPYVYSIIRGESMEKDCLRCHGRPDKAPASLVKIYGPTKSFNRSAGEVVSAVSIRVPLEQAYREADIFSAKLSAIVLCSILLIIFIQNKIVTRQIILPLEKFSQALVTIASQPDHLGKTIPLSHTREIHIIEESFNKISQRLRHHVDDLNNEVHKITNELNNSETKYRSLFVNMTTGFALHEMIYDEEGQPIDYRFLEVNPAFETLTNLSAQSIVGKTVKEVIPDIESYRIEQYGMVAKTGTPIAHQNFSKELQRYYDTWAFSPGKNLFAVIFSDITEQKHLEQLQEHRLQTLTNPHELSASITLTDLFNLAEIQKIQDAFALATGVASMITTPDGKPITKPSNFCDLCLNIIRKTEKGLANCRHSDATLGRMSPEGPSTQPCLSGGLLDGGTGIHVGGQHIANWLVGQVLDESCNLDKMAAYAREIGADEVEYRKALSQVKSMSKEKFIHICEALHQIAGQLSRMAIQNVNQAQYIAQRKRAEDALYASERRFRELLESVELLAVTLDNNGSVTFCNDHLIKVTNWSHEEITGKNWFDQFIPTSCREQMKLAFRQFLAGHRSLTHYENVILTRGGEERQVIWNNTLLHDAEGTVIGIASIGNDVTKHRNTEAQLRQSQKMEAVGQLAGGVAHDFNNILTVIGGYCSLLQMDGSLTKEQKGKIAEIASSAEKAAQLTQGLLAFSRKQPLVMKEENINTILKHVHKFLARIIGEDVTFHSTCYEYELLVHADKGQIEQVLINLATNARDAMPNGGVFTVKCDLAVLDSSFTDFRNTDAPPGKYALLSVSDTGTGISKENLDHIFEPFFTTKEVGKGTGLGMAIIYGIIKQHNGFINVHSEVGKGTTFRIYLPIQETYSETHIDKTEMATPTGGNETILVAEDDPSVRTLVSTMLAKYGHKVILAEDGVDAIKKFKIYQGNISLILMDMIMPNKNGKEAYEEIKRIKPEVKVLFLSGYTADFIENRGVSKEDIELIMKPVHPVELLRKIREMLDT